MKSRDAIEKYGEELWKKMNATGLLDGITIRLLPDGDVDIPERDLERAYTQAMETCDADIMFGNGHGDEGTTFQCQLPKNHKGPHKSSGTHYGEEYTLLWGEKYGKPCRHLHGDWCHHPKSETQEQCGWYLYGKETDCPDYEPAE